MKRIIILFLSAFICIAFSKDPDITWKNKDGKTESFNMRDYYEKHLAPNTPTSPDDFNVQDVINNMYSEDVLDFANGQNDDAFKDTDKFNDRFGAKSYDPEDKGSKGVGGFISGEVGSEINEWKNGEIVGKKTFSRKDLMKSTVMRLGNIAKSTGRASCYISRSQDFFNYRCSLNGISSSNPNGVDSPLRSKEYCERNCKVSSKCLSVNNPKDKQLEDIKESIATAVILSKSNPKQTITKILNADKKSKYFTFKLKNNVNIFFSFVYEDESGYKRVMAKDLFFPAQDETTLKNGGVQKKYRINAKVKKVQLLFYIPTGKQKGAIELDKYSDDSNAKNKLDVSISNIELLVPATKRFVCPSQNILKSIKKNSYAKSDLIDLVLSTGNPIQISKTASGGDNEDGTFSDLDTCTASCVTKGECVLENPPLNIDSFFGLKEGCLGGDSDSCKAKDCVAARENAAPILNETVFDAQGNATQTIINGAAVSGTIRPRIVSSDDDRYSQEKIEKEGKDRAFINMINDQTFALSNKLGISRETSYAYKKKNSEIYIKIKPSDKLYNKKMYVYVMIALQTSDNDHYITQSNQKVYYMSKYYYMLDSTSNLHPFYLDQGYNFTDSKDKIKNKFQTFNEYTEQWIGISKAKPAEIFKSYTDVLKEVKKNKYYIEEKILANENSPMFAKGVVRARAYFVSSSPSDLSNNAARDENSSSLIPLGDIYHTVKSNADIPSSILSRNAGAIPKIGHGDIPFQYYVYVIASDKSLTYEDIANELIIKDPKENLIYNLKGDNTRTISTLKDDSISHNEYVSIYLVGTADKLSAYASIRTKEDDIQENGYTFLWWNSDGNADKEKGSIKNLKPSDRKVFGFYEYLSANYMIPLFEDQNYSSKANEQVHFGYGTGKYDSKSDCKDFYVNGKLKRVCLPWWSIEREYDKKIDKSIPDQSFQEALKKINIQKMVENLPGKLVNVCTKIDPAANSLFNGGEKIVNCTSYYNKFAGGDCYDNPLQRKCFYDGCLPKVKENCELQNTLGFDSHLKSKVASIDVSDPSKLTNKLEDSKIQLKSYTYKCPAIFGVEINKVCLKEEQVSMNPVDCSDTSSLSSNQKFPSADLDIKKLRTNYVYCDTDKPIIDSAGNVTGFRGTCPISKKPIVCGINQVKTTTKTCAVPIFQSENYDDVSVQVMKRSCTDLSIDIASGQKDIYESDKSCLRINNAMDSRDQNFSVTFANNNVPYTFIVSKNYKSEQKIEYCKYVGDKHSSLPKDCKDNSHGVMNFTSTINGAKDILFSEQIGTLSGDGFIVGIESKDYFLYGNKPPLKSPSNASAKAKNPNNPFSLTKPKLVGILIDTGLRKISNYEYKDIPRWLTWLISSTYDNSKLNYEGNSLEGTEGYRKIQLFPETKGYNFSGSNWIKDTFSVSHKNSPGRNYWTDRGDSCRCISNNCDWTWFGVEKDYRCSYDGYKALKLYNNATLGISILLPTASDYEFYFYDKNGNVIAKEILNKVDLLSQPAGVLQAFPPIVSELKTARQTELETLVIPKKQEEIRSIEFQIKTLKGLRYRVTKKSDHQVFIWPILDSRDLNRMKKNFPSCNITMTNTPFFFHPNAKEATFDCPIDRYYINDKEINVYIYDALKSISTKTDINGDDFTVCLSNYDYDGTSLTYKEVQCDNNIKQLEDKLKKFKDELKDLEDERRKEAPNNGSTDPFSPIGGGTLFGISFVNGTNTDFTRDLNYIREKSIYSIAVIDKITGVVTTKKLEFPLPFLNRIFYGYLKSVETRRYKCCSVFQNSN